MSEHRGRAQQRLAYITDLALTPSGGGAYAVNFHAYEQLSRCFTTTYVGPIVPKQRLLEKLVSKVKRRLLGRAGRFTYFSETTLDSNAREVTRRLDAQVDALVFRSAARWCRVAPERPYFVYLDAVFHTFFHNTFRERDFDRTDLERIFEEEARFLEGASAVFFESHWGMAMAREAYSLKGSHYMTVGRGGVIEPPESDTWDGQSHRLLTIAMNFEQKGGDVALDAYVMLKERHPSLTWHIVGAEPTGNWKDVDGISYEGFLKPDDHAHRERLKSLFANSFLLIHPTREDTSPLVITEAAYFGCPAISVNRFAVPELVVHGVTGLLVNSPSASEIAKGIAELLANEQRYRDMRRNAREHALSRYRWGRVGRLMCDSIASSIARS